MHGPPPTPPDQTYVSVSPIPAGRLTLPERFFLSDADPTATRTVPSLAFLVTHPTHAAGAPFRLLFDLGLRRALDRYPAPQQAHLATRAPYALPPGGVPAALRRHGLAPAAVALVLLSHVHYDHHGDPEDFGPPTRFAVGPGALALLAHGLPGGASHQHFEPALLPAGRALELPGAPGAPNSRGARVLETPGAAWAPLGPFAAALDLLGDGSVFAVAAPGHLPGHVNLLCRVRARHWAYLAGDTAHDRRILSGERGVGTWAGAGGATHCIHADKAAAEASIAAVRAAQRAWADAGERLEVLLAHDDVWEGDAANAGRLWPGQL